MSKQDMTKKELIEWLLIYGFSKVGKKYIKENFKLYLGKLPKYSILECEEVYENYNKKTIYTNFSSYLIIYFRILGALDGYK